MNKIPNMCAFNASQRQFIHSFTFLSSSLWWVFLKAKVLLRNIHTHWNTNSGKAVLKAKIFLKNCFDILLENQKNKRKIKCFILHWLLHENVITLILCWGEERIKICLCFQTAADFAPFKPFVTQDFKANCLKLKKNTLKNCITSNKRRKEDKLVLVLTDNEENYVKRLNYLR